MERNNGVSCNVKQCIHNEGGVACNLNVIEVGCGCNGNTSSCECTCCNSYRER